jgi:hypothetical protein
MSFDDDWGRPQIGGEFTQPRDLEGHLLIIYPIGYIPYLPTRFTTPGKKSDAICVDVVDLDAKAEDGTIGKVYRNCNWMQAQIIQNLKPMIGSKVLGTIGKGVAKNGMNQPWTIIDLLDNPGAKQRAVEWREANPNFRTSTFVPRTEQEPAAPAPAPQQPSYQAPQQPSYSAPQQGYQAPQQGYLPPAQYAPASGSPTMTDEEMSVLQAMRARTEQRRQQEAQHYQPNPGFEDKPPF